MIKIVSEIFDIKDQSPKYGDLFRYQGFLYQIVKSAYGNRYNVIELVTAQIQLSADKATAQEAIQGVFTDYTHRTIPIGTKLELLVEK